MYSVVCGINHPRLCEDISHKNFEFFDIGEDEANTIILTNLMKKVLDNNSNKNIVKVFEEFFDDRAISNDRGNIYYQRILAFFVEYNKWYNGNKSSAIRFYLVKRNVEESKVVDVVKMWKAYREQKENFTLKKKRSNNRL